MAWTIGHDEPFDEYECEGDCEDECTCLDDQEEWDEDINQILEREHEAAQDYHARYPNGWSPD